MNIIFLSRRDAQVRHVNLGHPLSLALSFAALLGLLGGAFAIGRSMGEHSGFAPTRNLPSQLAQTLTLQHNEISELKSQLQERVDAVAARLGMLNAHIIRIDALGKRLTRMANISDREFNFDVAPATGGPEVDGAAAEIPDLTRMINTFENRLRLRDSQLTALENVILVRQLNEQIVPDGRPVQQGFISSYFGDRQDPFTGHEAFHKGVDFAATQGDHVMAVAAGVVSFSGDKQGFGNVVEVSHGNGYITRYGHNLKNLVTVGQMVKRGDTVSLMGSTGRSTGPHVHFEVLRNGIQIDPLSYIGE
jgi:murein DD-endopeptidase MepM/ murein hydrolase activator NlpD